MNIQVTTMYSESESCININDASGLPSATEMHNLLVLGNDDTYGELNLEFSSKELAIEYAKQNNIDFELIEPKIRKVIKKSYSDNFTD